MPAAVREEWMDLLFPALCFYFLFIDGRGGKARCYWIYPTSGSFQFGWLIGLRLQCSFLDDASKLQQERCTSLDAWIEAAYRDATDSTTTSRR